MFLILTSKPGQFRTELGADLHEVEAWEYHAHGRTRAKFVIAELAGATKIRIVDEGAYPVVNQVPSKFFPKFDTLEAARAELRQLSGAASTGTTLVRL
jgi:hypothetical protein